MKISAFSLLVLCFYVVSSPLESLAQDKDAIYIIFDASGSMWGELPDQSRKVTVAKQVLEDFVAGDFEGYELALRAYGHRRKGDCRDSELVVPFGPPEQVVGQVQAFAKNLNPLGKTPISYSLRQALADFGDRSGKIILISDGIETCDEDPCALVREWREKDIQIKVHVVGLGLDEKAKSAMQCIAEAAGTEYRDAESATTLAEGLAQIQEEAKTEQVERQTTIALRLIGKDAAGRRVQVEGVLKQQGEDRYEVSSNARNVVESGSYELVAGVPTKNGTIYQPATKTVEVAETGETTVEVEVEVPPSVYATFTDADEKQRGALVPAYQNDREAFTFRWIDTVYVEPGTYDFRATPNAENELSVTETLAPGDVKEIVFRLVHTVHVKIKMVASGSDIHFRQNYELWQDGEKKYRVHVNNGNRSVLPGTYDIHLPDRLTPYIEKCVVITEQDKQHFDFTVSVGHATFTYQNADGTPAADKRCFVGNGPDGKGFYHNTSQRYPLRPGTYNVEGWRGNYDRVVFEVKQGEDTEVVLREKG